MFISSYNTYNGISNIKKNNNNKSSEKYSSFNLYNPESTKAFKKSTLYVKPISYLYDSKTFNNKYRLQKQDNPKNQIKFAKLTSLSDAKSAYEESSKIYSFFKTTNININQTPKIDKRLPEEIQRLKIKNLHRIMLNTYIENDNYYKITA